MSEKDALYAKERYHSDPEVKRKRLESTKAYHNRNLEKRRASIRKSHAKTRSTKEGVIKSNLYVRKTYALKRGWEFNISVEDLLPLPTHCPVFNTELEYFNNKPGPNSPGIDRIDNSKGYIVGNVQIISHRANLIKNDASLSELKQVVAYLEGLEGA